MRERSTDADENEVPDRVLQHRAVAHFEKVAQISLVASRPRPQERHITESSRNLHQAFAGHLGIGLPRDAVVCQKAVQLRLRDELPSHEVDGGRTNNTDLFVWI